MIGGYSKPTKHYAMCFVKIHKSLPCNDVEVYELPPEYSAKIFEK